MVRALGRELRVWHERRAAGARSDWQIYRRGWTEGREVAEVSAKSRRRIWGIDSLLLRRVAERKREEHCFADSVGADWAARGRGTELNSRAPDFRACSI